MSPVETPDATVDHFPEVCAVCGAVLSEAMATDHAARQVFDLPGPQALLVTEHRAFACRCVKCGRHYTTQRGTISLEGLGT